MPAWLEIATIAAIGAGLLAQGAALWLLRRRLDAVRAILDSYRRVEDLVQLAWTLEARIDRLDARREAPPEQGTTPPAPATGTQRRVDPPHHQAPATGPTLIEVPSLAAPSPSTLAEELDQRFGPFWTLEDAGHAPDEIARQTGHPIGEVELILGLRRQRPMTRLARAGDGAPHA